MVSDARFILIVVSTQPSVFTRDALIILHRLAMPSHMYNIIIFGQIHHQLAFLTPGKFPARAFILKGYYTHDQCLGPKLFTWIWTHPCHPEILEHTPRFASLYAPVIDLREPGITMHLRQL